jgi:hypothetical protein
MHPPAIRVLPGSKFQKAISFDAKVTGKPQGQDAKRVFNCVRLVRDIL